ncbi:hypothetical protein UlMin_032986 [Ulmus minor]
MSASHLMVETIWKGIESTGSMIDEELSILLKWVLTFGAFCFKSSLHFLFGKNFPRATRILDQRGIKRVVGESWRKEEYACFLENFCACYSFFYDIVNRGEQLCFDQLVILL